MIDRQTDKQAGAAAKLKQPLLSVDVMVGMYDCVIVQLC